jgi:hypothetical protein
MQATADSSACFDPLGQGTKHNILMAIRFMLWASRYLTQLKPQPPKEAIIIALSKSLATVFLIAASFIALAGCKPG